MTFEEVAFKALDYGVQTLVIVWFLFRIEKAMERNTQAFEKFAVVVEDCKRRA